MLIVLSGFSQKDTVKTVINNDSVSLSKPVTRRVIQDIIRYDALKQEYVILNNSVYLLKEENAKKDTIISIKDKQISAYNSIIADYKKNQKNYQEEVSDLTKELKRSKVKQSLFGYLALAGLVLFAVK